MLLAAGGPADGRSLVAACKGKDGWTDPAPPVRIFGNTYDVGTCGITVLLVTSPQGHILIDAGPVEAAPLVAANIARLGYRLRDVRLIMSSHEHRDHAGGLATIKAMTGAKLAVRAPARAVLESGVLDPDDPQAEGRDRSPAVAVDRVVRDGERVTLGPLALTAHATPGHSPGSTTWSWISCGGARCARMVYADSLTAVSGDHYRFRDHPAYVARFRRTIATVAALPCDIVVTPHPAASRLFERLAGAAPLIDRNGCRRYAADASQALDARITKEAR